MILSIIVTLIYISFIFMVIIAKARTRRVKKGIYLRRYF